MVMQDFFLHLYRFAEIPEQGACDSRPHEVTMKFEGEDEHILEIKVMSVKSTADNCLINAMS
jgi:hypothetical protein